MTPSRLPDWPRLLRGTMAAAYVGMTSAQFDRAVASGEMPDPIMTSAGERWDRVALDIVVDRRAGNVANDWTVSTATRTIRRLHRAPVENIAV